MRKNSEQYGIGVKKREKHSEKQVAQILKFPKHDKNVCFGNFLCFHVYGIGLGGYVAEETTVDGTGQIGTGGVLG